MTVWVLAVAKVVLHLGTTRLSFHRDELYFISASKRLAASYVDFQPVTPLLVRVARLAFGGSLIGLRLIPALAGAAAIVLGALITRELAGDRRAQVFGAFFLLIVPLFVGMDTAVNTVSLETPAFMLVILFLVRLIRTADARLWVAVGAASGLALLVKFTFVGYLFGLGVAVLLTPLRKYLGSLWLWAGVGIAVLVVAPSVVWQLTNGLPVLEFVSNQGGGGAVLGLRGRLGYVASLVILPGPFGLFVLVPGMLLLLREDRFRPIGIAIATSLLTFFVASGKGYYAAPAIAVILCAGAVAASAWSRRRRRLLVAALIVNLLIPLVLVLPIVPMSLLRDNPDLADATELGERIGWDDLAATTARVARSLDADERDRAIVLGRNYALSSAIEYYAEEFDLPPSVSGQNSSFLWWPDIDTDHVAIAIGFEEEFLRRLYGDVECVAKVTNEEGVDNYEYGKSICIARQPKVTPVRLRDAVKVFTA